MAPRGRLEALKSGLRGLSGREASKQEVNASSFPTAAGPALPLVPGVGAWGDERCGSCIVLRLLTPCPGGSVLCAEQTWVGLDR